MLLVAVFIGLPGAFKPQALSVVRTFPRPRPLPLSDVKITLTKFADLPRPTAMATRYRDDAIYVTSKRGVVYAIRGYERETILDISKKVAGGFEQGLLGIAFTPDGRLLIINFTDLEGRSVTRAYNFDGEVDERSARDLLVVPKPLPEHNAGMLAFGPDRYLYFSLGDGGKPADPDDKGQSLNTLLGKIHRLDILPNRTYAIPPDNPFVRRPKARPEIWAYGFRNPWRFSFDRLTGDLWIADVGSKRREEVSFEAAGTGGGLNYGWNRFEGRRRYNDKPRPKEHVLPVHEYSHDDNECAVAGGYVYRGDNVPALYGAYLFSDFCKGRLEALRLGRDGKVSEHRQFGFDVAQVSSFGQDADGELYLLNLTKGAIYRIDPA